VILRMGGFGIIGFLRDYTRQLSTMALESNAARAYIFKILLSRTDCCNLLRAFAVEN